MSLKPSSNNRRFSSKNTFSGRSSSSVIESNGPTGKARGTAQQLLERYLTLARDAVRDGDTVLAEGFSQHAEHYRRIVAEQPSSSKQRSFEEGMAVENAKEEEAPEIIFQLDEDF